jgi:hypothetical protein
VSPQIVESINDDTGGVTVNRNILVGYFCITETFDCIKSQIPKVTHKEYFFFCRSKLPSFRHGLHGAVGMIFYVHVVYVVVCYMSIICYMSVICLVQSLPQEEVTVFGYIEGPFLVIRTGCTSERHAPCIEGSFLVNRTDHACERHAP